LLAARGSWRAKARANAGEPQPKRAAPKCPDHLAPDARREWKRITRLLMPLGLLTVIDGDQLALYCTAYARWADAEKHLQEDGVIVKAPTGYPIQNPYPAVAHKSMELMHGYLAKFGMNPSDRGRVHVQRAPEKPGLDAFKLGGKPQLRIAP
jgi:P27 family predicted phage terminase small subunit